MAPRSPSVDPEELALVARANAGEAAAFEALYRRQRDWALALARRFGGDADDAAEVVQETFVYFFSRFPGFVLSSSLRSYLYPIIKHHSIDVARRKAREQPIPADHEILGWHVPASDEDFVRLVASLPPEQAEVVRMRFGLDFQLDEIAEALDIPLGTVKSRLHNALKALRSAIE